MHIYNLKWRALEKDCFDTECRWPESYLGGTKDTRLGGIDGRGYGD